MTKTTIFSRSFSSYRQSSRQRGVVLIVALVMLLIMTSMGITSMTGATLQERMAGNSRQQFNARLNAEQGLTAGEAALAGWNVGAMGEGTLGDFITATPGFFPTHKIATTIVVDHGINFTDPNTWAAGVDTGIAVGANNPRYVIEYMGGYDNTGLHESRTSGAPPPSMPYVFRVTAIGWGDDANSFSVLQSYYVVDN